MSHHAGDVCGDARRAGQRGRGSGFRWRDKGSAHRHVFAAFQDESGNVTRETGGLVEAPGGTQIVVWAEEEDMEACFEHMMTTTGFGEWFRGQIAETTGIDMPESDGDPSAEPEQIVDWTLWRFRPRSGRCWPRSA